MDERTLFIITSDHNPHSGGEYTELVKNEKDRQSIAPIPLIFVSKNLAPLENLDNSAYSSQIDIAPTLLCLQGIQPPQRFIGRNLLQQYKEPDCALGFLGTKPIISAGICSLWTRLTSPIRNTNMKMRWRIMSCTHIM